MGWMELNLGINDIIEQYSCTSVLHHQPGQVYRSVSLCANAYTLSFGADVTLKWMEHLTTFRNNKNDIRNAGT